MSNALTTTRNGLPEILACHERQELREVLEGLLLKAEEMESLKKKKEREKPLHPRWKPHNALWNLLENVISGKTINSAVIITGICKAH